jgi:cell division protein FtsL
MKKTVRKFKETVEIQSSFLQRLRSHRYFTVIVLAAAFLLVSCFYVWQRVRVLELVKDVSYLDKDHAELLDDLRKVRSDIGSLTLAARIEVFATDTLGMKPIDADRLFTLAPKKSNPDEPDDLAAMISAIRHVADYMPVISEAEVRADQLRIINVDTISNQGAVR